MLKEVEEIQEMSKNGLQITVGKYTLKSDNFNLWLEKDKPTKTGTVTKVKVAGYATSFEGLLDSFMNKKFRMCKDLKDIEAIIKEVSKIEAECKKMIRDYYKAKEEYYLKKIEVKEPQKKKKVAKK